MAGDGRIAIGEYPQPEYLDNRIRRAIEAVALRRSLADPALQATGLTALLR